MSNGPKERAAVQAVCDCVCGALRQYYHVDRKKMNQGKSEILARYFNGIKSTPTRSFIFFTKNVYTVTTDKVSFLDSRYGEVNAEETDLKTLTDRIKDLVLDCNQQGFRGRSGFARMLKRHLDPILKAHKSDVKEERRHRLVRAEQKAGETEELTKERDAWAARAHSLEGQCRHLSQHFVETQQALVSVSNVTGSMARGQQQPPPQFYTQSGSYGSQVGYLVPPPSGYGSMSGSRASSYCGSLPGSYAGSDGGSAPGTPTAGLRTLTYPDRFDEPPPALGSSMASPFYGAPRPAVAGPPPAPTPFAHAGPPPPPPRPAYPTGWGPGQ